MFGPDKSNVQYGTGPVIVITETRVSTDKNLLHFRVLTFFLQLYGKITARKVQTLQKEKGKKNSQVLVQQENAIRVHKDFHNKSISTEKDEKRMLDSIFSAMSCAHKFMAFFSPWLLNLKISLPVLCLDLAGPHRRRPFLGPVRKRRYLGQQRLLLACRLHAHDSKGNSGTNVSKGCGALNNLATVLIAVL